MDKSGTLWAPLILLTLTQIQCVLASGCGITSVSSPSASTLKVIWSGYSDASIYLLDLRVVNSTSIAPVVVEASASNTQRLVRGLRPGQTYEVKLKVFRFLYVVCTDTRNAMTVPATSQITFSQALSSTSMRFEWSSVIGADKYFLIVEKLFDASAPKYNRSFTTLGGQVDGLTPSTTYKCYVYSSNSAGLGASSRIRTITTLVQPPTGVALESTGKNTARVTWNTVSRVLLYQVTVRDNDDPSSPPIVRNTSSASMDISNLEPCSTYTVGVSSVNVFLVAGEASEVIYTTTTINRVSSVSVDYSCTSGMVTVIWALVFGANSYRATAMDRNGTALSCTSDSTSCQITKLKCGEQYQVQVTAISDDCESTSNTSVTFETIPCAPANLQTSRECSSNIIIFTWEPTNNTYYYVAKALDNTGNVVECRTPDTTCFFTNTGCGQSYQYTVYAVSTCNSEVSAPKFVKTSPCLPTNVRTSADCQSEVLITTWDSAAGALSYFVEAHGNNGDNYNCSSFTNSCAVAGVPCGEHLSVWITALDDDCSTNKVLGEVAETVPCTPTNVSAIVGCSHNSARVNWTVSNGAVFYIAIAQHADGTEHSCNSMGTNCLIEGLRCGEMYNASIIATNAKCNSSLSEQVTLMTAPCPPLNVEAFRDCAANHALIVWQDHQSAGSYRATIVDKNGGQLNCTSDTVNNCKIPSLPCGQNYNVTVTYNDGNCPSSSTPISMDSVPCGPQDVWTSVACGTGELTVAWNISVPAENYTTVVSTGTGQRQHCNSTETQCTLGGLECGSSYMVTVFSVHGTCFSLPSTDVTVHTGTCPPTNVTVTRTCGQSSVAVTWVASLGAVNYTAVAVGTGGHRAECSTNETSCSIHQLQCGEVYTVGVVVVDDNCTSQLSQTVSLHTVPCPPSDLSSQLNCTEGTAQLSWPPSPNAVTYTASTTGPVGEVLSCNSSSPGCLLSGLVCGQEYNITVSASDGTCASHYSVPLRQNQVRCAPLNVTTNLLCDTNILMVSWDPAAVQHNYSAIATAITGDAVSVTCHTADTNCSLSGLRCGHMYNVSVMASSVSCSGPQSTPLTVQTAPCAPERVEGMMLCGSLSLLASWNASLGATSYTAMAMGPNGYSETCSSPNLTCTFTGLQCSSQYDITVMSQDAHCTSTPSRTSIMTVPCGPANVTSFFQCGSEMATVTWAEAAGAVGYTVLAFEDGSQLSTSCRSNTTSCQMDQLNCGTVYSLTVLAEDANCNGTGSTSTVLRTAPCPPSIQNITSVCNSNSTSLSWMPVINATGYIANATTANGHVVSCSSATASCEFTDLLCGETYTATVIARGDRCDSKPNATVFTTGPCAPTITFKQFVCGNNTAMFGWTDLVGHVAFLAQMQGGGHVESCLTTNTSCVFHNLSCGLDYTMTVQTQGAQCNSTPSASESIQTVPCAPQNVSATLVCANNSALVTWVGSPGAISYNVTAVGPDGHNRHCQTNGTGCQLHSMHCGQAYGITVVPYSESCAGNPSTVYSLNTGLCPPSNVTVSSECQLSTASWSYIAGAEMYIATATGNDGHTHNCSSNNNSCSFADLHCGENYSVTVATIGRGCRGRESSVVELRTALCQPTDLESRVNCATNTLNLTWAESPVSGATYNIYTKKIGDMLGPVVYNTSNTSHLMTGLLCGERYSIYITARDGTCESRHSAAIEIGTAPCQPSNLTVRVDCGTNKANFSWNESDGADFYTTEVTGEHGHVASCSSNGSSCAVKLQCGRSYSATLVASTHHCNSSQFADIRFDSAPCLPENVVAELDCDANVLNVSWQETPGSDNYTALAIGSDDYRASCNSTSNSCSIHGLQCGQTYEVAVTSSSISCEIIAGSDYQVQSAPCKPENTTVDLNCSTNIVAVKWDHNSRAQNYTVRATDTLGVNSTCTTNETSCSFLDLSCGELYAFTVMGHTNVCVSEMSAPVPKLTAPCPPSNVSASLNCSTGEALVTWSSAVGATAYSVQAHSINGHNSSCSGTGTGTSCSLGDLVCGQEYTVVVVAVHTGCPGLASVPVLFTTAPCPPSNVSASLNCSTGEALVTWSSAVGATVYNVQAHSINGHNSSCSDTGTSCSLGDLVCGQEYTVVVAVMHTGCPGPASVPIVLTKEPCVPMNVSVQYDVSMAQVTWDAAKGASSYSVEAVTEHGLAVNCTTTSTNCDLTDMQCGHIYNITVTTHNPACNNTVTSDTYHLMTEPCTPTNIQASTNCEQLSGMVSWGKSNFAVGYVAYFVGQNDLHASCMGTNTDSSCIVSGLICGTVYNISVKALGQQYNSSESSIIYLTSAPCLPSALQAEVDCSSDGAVVSWNIADGIADFSLTALVSGIQQTLCTTRLNSCNVTGLSCGESYDLSLSASNEQCNLTAPVNANLTTRPCAPQQVTVDLQCGSQTAVVTWEERSEVALYVTSASGGSGGEVQWCNSTGFTCQFPGLACGETYNFTVTAQSQGCSSQANSTTSIKTAPCQPSNLTVHVDCGTNKANFSWNESDGADFYTVEATGEHGHVASCSSNGSSCAVKLQCGRSYSATLVASTHRCNSSQFADIHFDSAPCLPENVVAELDCDANVLNVSWQETPGSDNYTALAISGDGYRASCNSTSNSCSIHGLQCGQTYEVAVTSSSISCEIIAGSDYQVQSAPCKPENTTVDLNCSTNIVTVKWDHNSRAQNYTVRATDTLGVNSTCSTNETSCSFLDLSCGELYTFTVMGHTNVCVSEMSTPVQKLTAPCPPSNVSSSLNCSTGEALVTWSSAVGAIAYSVQAHSINGHNSSCSDTGMSCSLGDVVCGQEYTVVVVAMHTGCPGPASVPVILTTEPCVPMNVSVQYDVSMAQVTWDAARGASSYSVEAVTEHGLPVNCTTTSTNCGLTDMQCGHIYNITVTTHNPACNNTVTSDTHHLMTEPCPPTNIQASMDCEQLSGMVSWMKSNFAVGYVAYFIGQSGHHTSCVGRNTDSYCVVWGLMCSTVYNVSVKALGQQYNSSDSTTLYLTSGPCQPSGIEAILDCQEDSAIVSWQPGTSVVSYVTELKASSGHSASCFTNLTNCVLSSLHCGEEYNVTVVALGETCNNTGQLAGYLITEPCVPVNMSVQYDVSMAQVMWDAARGASSYSVEAVTEHGLAVNCTTNSTNCGLTGMQCGHIYNITVTTHNLACNGTVTSDTYHLMTEPCPPTSVQAHMNCEELAGTISWEQSNFAVGYVASFVGQNGHYSSCVVTNANTHCRVSELTCGTVYNISVMALGQQHNSSDSTVIYLTSAPCLPSALQVEVDCHFDGAAVVSWNITDGIADFSLTALVSGIQHTLCTTQLNSCNVTGLSCGESYDLSLSASNEQCNLTAPVIANLTTGPCAPQNVTVDLQCGSQTAVVTWEERSEVELYITSASGGSGGQVQWCNSTGSTCQFPGLACGETYNFTVTAQSQGCSSQASSTAHIETGPCQPEIASIQALCQSNVVQMSWQQAKSVVSYLVKTTGSLGYVETYNTTETHLSTSLPCGQDYNVTVQGHGSQCDSIPSSPASFKTTPCIPQAVVTYVQCESNIGSVSWAPSDGAETYVAVATGHDGHTHQHVTSNTSCTWWDLHCGEEYAVQVRAKADNCTSLPSNSSVIHMGPCVPQDLVGSVDCALETGTLSWNVSEGADLYVVKAEVGNSSVVLTTNDTIATFTDFTCGQVYNLTVTPHNQHCPGGRGALAFLQTWPCRPTAVMASLDCLSGIVVVTWQDSNGADYYTAAMQTADGLSNTCMSSSGQCSVPGLACGQNFSVSVTAFNELCNSTSSMSASLQTVPCVPTDVSVLMDCANSTALVSWSISQGAVQYSVHAYSSQGNATCQSSELNCTLTQLVCGTPYTVQVAAMDGSCSSTPSQAVTVNSAPCPPQNVSASDNCSLDALMVSWDGSADAEYFLVAVMADGGGSNSCNTTNTSCSIGSLACGKQFTVEVRAVRGDCTSQSSQPLDLFSAPCQPQGIRGSLDCVTNSAWISWNSTEGAEGYTVLAEGGEGSRANCTTSTNTTCEVQDLACGVVYNFSVIGTNSLCDSQPSATIDLETAPCSLSSITAFAQCHNSSILVNWELLQGGEGSTVYIATAEASDHTYLSCNSTGTSCYLHGAQCDLHYIVIVAASSDLCSSLRSPPYRISMEPCPPRNVIVSASCEDHDATVSWSPSPVAETYHVTAMGGDGHLQSCSTSSSNCSLSGLHCGQQYTMFVTASHENCSSVASQNVTLKTVPCPPDGLSVTLHCANRSAVLSWTPRGNATDYFGCAQAEDGTMLYCHSTEPTCTIASLECGAHYNFSVQASDRTCNSSFSDPVLAGAAPCPPGSLQVQLFPMQMEIQIMRFRWTQITCPEVQYLLKLTGSLLGDNQTLFELSSYWTNSTFFEIPLPCGSSYLATVESRSPAGASAPSEALSGTTAPCPPSGVTYGSGGSSATVSWDASIYATSYTLYNKGVSPMAPVCSTAQLTCSVYNISSSDLTITASNAAGESEAISVVPQGRRRRDLSEEMLDYAGNLSVPSVWVTAGTPTAVRVEWSPVEGASHYSLVVRQRGGSHRPQVLTVLGESTILTDLNPDSTYCLSVSAQSTTSNGSYSEPVCVQMGRGLQI